MRQGTKLAAGVDLGDRESRVVILDAEGEVGESWSVRTRPEDFRRAFGGLPRLRIAMETGSPSRWASRLLEELGHEVLVGHARQLRLIHGGHTKSDRLDAEKLARLVRLDPKLLNPVYRRSDQGQSDLLLCRARGHLVQCRTKLANLVRGSVKSFGIRLGRCTVEQLARTARAKLSEGLRETLDPVLDQLEELTRRIRGYDHRIEEVAQARYPVTAQLRQVNGVGPVTSLAYVVAVEDPDRFAGSRRVGSYFGLRPGRDQSGDQDVPQRITKAGNPFVRGLLLQCAHYMLGAHGKDSDLRRYGLRIASRGGKIAKRKALVAVARKLAVLLHRLWITGEVYDPLRVARATGELQRV